MPSKDELERGFRIGDWEVIPGRRILKRGDEEVQPEPKVFGCLMALALRGGDAVSRDEFVDEVWDGRLTGDDAITRCIKELRNHLGDKKPFRYVKALHGLGYLLMEEVVLNEPDDVAVVPAAEPAPAASPGSNKYRVMMIGAVLIAIAAFLLISEPWRPTTGDNVRVGVMPFENASNDPSQQHLVSGFQGELIRTLYTVPDLAVVNGRVSYPDESAIEIADILDVDNVLTGVVQAMGGELKVTYALTSGASNEILESGSVTGSVERFFELQEELAEKVRNQLVGGRSPHLVSSSRPSNFDAYNTYLQGLYAFERRFNDDNLDVAMELFTETIRLDPGFGPAYLQLATAYALLPPYRGADLAESHSRAIEIVEQGIDVDPSIEQAAGAVFGFIYHSRKEWPKAELAYEQATTAAIVDSNAFNWYSRMLASVGRLRESRDVALRAWELDPDNAVINSRVALAYSWLGDAEHANDFFERSRRLGVDGTTHLMAHALFLAREGMIEDSREVAKGAAGSGGLPRDWIDAVIAGMQDPVYADAALHSVNETVAAGDMTSQIEFVVRTLLGDLDGSMAVARRLEQPGEEFEMDLLWLPEFQGLRQRPDFLELMQNLGIEEYWDLNNCKWVEANVVCPD